MVTSGIRNDPTYLGSQIFLQSLDLVECFGAVRLDVALGSADFVELGMKFLSSLIARPTLASRVNFGSDGIL